MCYVVEYSLQSFYESMHAEGIKKTIKFWLVGGIWGGWLGGGVRSWILCPIYNTGSSEGEREMGMVGGGGGKKTCQIDGYSYTILSPIY